MLTPLHDAHGCHGEDCNPLFLVGWDHDISVQPRTAIARAGTSK
jgi:hypothetical protein